VIRALFDPLQGHRLAAVTYPALVLSSPAQLRTMEQGLDLWSDPASYTSVVIAE